MFQLRLSSFSFDHWVQPEACLGAVGLRNGRPGGPQMGSGPPAGVSAVFVSPLADTTSSARNGMESAYVFFRWNEYGSGKL